MSGSAPFSGLLCDARPALPGGVDDRHVEDRVEVEVGHVVGHVARETEQQVLALGDDLVDARVGTVGLVDEQDDRQPGLERLAQHEAGLRQRALARVDEQHDAVDHREAALDLAAEVGVTGGVDDVDRDRGRRCACTPSYAIAVFLARIVMPFSRSSSFESIARSSTWACSANEWVCLSMASTSVVLPWSTWATIATLRRSLRVALAMVSVLSDACRHVAPSRPAAGGAAAARKRWV